MDGQGRRLVLFPDDGIPFCTPMLVTWTVTASTRC